VAHTRAPVATEEVARLACASGAFTRGPNYIVNRPQPAQQVGVLLNAKLGRVAADAPKFAPHFFISRVLVFFARFMGGAQ